MHCHSSVDLTVLGVGKYLALFSLPDSEPKSEYLKNLVVGIGKRSPEIEIIEVNTDVDHVHILLTIPPLELINLTL